MKTRDEKVTTTVLLLGCFLFFSAFYRSKAIWLRKSMFVGMMENEEG
jgi:hypothetical protein